MAPDVQPERSGEIFAFWGTPWIFQFGTTGGNDLVKDTGEEARVTVESADEVTGCGNIIELERVTVAAVVDTGVVENVGVERAAEAAANPWTPSF